jgi:hypothetical protein
MNGLRWECEKEKGQNVATFASVNYNMTTPNLD